VLGAALRDNEAIADVLGVLDVEDFRTDAHRRLWAAMLALFDKGQAVEPVTLAELLERQGHLADVGGPSYIGKLYVGTATSAHAVRHARVVRDRSIIRQLAAAAHQIVRDAEDPADDAEATLEAAEQRIYAIADRGSRARARKLGEALPAVCERIDRRAQDGQALRGLRTGLADLDYLLAGLQSGELILLAARPSVGKTALGLAIACEVALSGTGVFFASLEQPLVDLAERALCSRAGVDLQRVRHGESDEADHGRLLDALPVLRQAPLWVDDTSPQGMVRVAATARRLKRQHGVGLVVVDYLQLVQPDDRKAPRHEQVGAVSRRLKGLARELSLPVLALAQLNRASEERAGGRPRLADLRESGSLEADADTVLLLHDPREGRALEVLVAKQRNGPVGQLTVNFDRATQRFQDAEPADPGFGASILNGGPTRRDPGQRGG
jgi:replicative DNA helicase